MCWMVVLALFEVGFRVGILMVGQNSMRGRAGGQWLPRILMSQQGPL
jgi:hypothetical protein